MHSPGPNSALVAATLVLGLGGLAAPSLAQPDANGYEWATITNPGNPAYTGFDPNGYVTGRGSVGYEYRMARTEVSTAQWMEFFNTFCPREGNIPWVSDAFPAIWGAGIDPTYSGPGHRFRLKGIADAAHVGVYGVTWRTCAMYCNWLNNGKSSDAASLLSGAYDVSTFHDNVDGTFTDQPTHSPGAQYWIPTLDEWLKSAHWSPANPSNGGWFTYSNGSEIALTYGPPPSFGGDGTGQANAIFRLSGSRQYNIPLGSYPNTPSIWGLLDIAGAGSEWMEDILYSDQGALGRFQGGSYASGPSSGDRVTGVGGVEPWTTAGNFNLRLASSVASPNGFGILGLVFALDRGWQRTRRRHEAYRTNCNRVVRGGGRVYSVTASLGHRPLRSRRVLEGAQQETGPKLPAARSRRGRRSASRASATRGRRSGSGRPAARQASARSRSPAHVRNQHRSTCW